MGGKVRTDCYCINLRRAANTVTDLYDHCLDSAGISVTQYSLLSNLQSIDGCNVTALAERMGLERTTVVRTLRPLIDSGLIVDVSSAGQRDRILKVTEKGAEVISQCRILWMNAQKEVERRLGEEGVSTLRDLLERLNED